MIENRPYTEGGWRSERSCSVANCPTRGSPVQEPASGSGFLGQPTINRRLDLPWREWQLFSWWPSDWRLFPCFPPVCRHVARFPDAVEKGGTRAFIVRYPASALKSHVNQQIGAAERPWTHRLHTGGTLLMPNTVDVRTNADNDQSAHTGSASLTSSLGNYTSMGNKRLLRPRR